MSKTFVTTPGSVSVDSQGNTFTPDVNGVLSVPNASYDDLLAQGATPADRMYASVVPLVAGFTAAAATYANKVIAMTATADINVTLPANAPIGMQFRLIKLNDNTHTIDWVAASGATVQKCEQAAATWTSHLQALQYSVVTAVCYANSDGSSAAWVVY